MKLSSFFFSASLLAILAWPAQAAQLCRYGASGGCPAGEFCINVDKGKSECQRSFKGELITIGFPFASNVPVICDQGPLSPPSNSHTWMNTAFALDLQSDRTQKDVSVFAGISGKAIVYNECTTENDQCGLGFGNSVKILRDDGYLVFYAHLKMAMLKTGDHVKTGDRIGLEGTTGWTGEKNRHLHMSVHYDWKPSGYDYWKRVGYLPPSIPYKLNICEKCSPKCKNIETDIRKLSCLRTNNQAKPVCGSSI